MTFKVAMTRAINLARNTEKLLYVYERNGEFEISNDYRRGWLFLAYPGGRKELSLAGAQMVEQIKRS